jgi:hypothetical protein
MTDWKRDYSDVRAELTALEDDLGKNFCENCPMAYVDGGGLSFNPGPNSMQINCPVNLCFGEEGCYFRDIAEKLKAECEQNQRGI